MYTEVYEDRDHREWHGGVERYGVWCLQVPDGPWSAQIDRYQSQLASVLHAGYGRFPHITLATVGLMTSAQWATVGLQRAALAALVHCAVEAEWAGFSSYSHSPIVRVRDCNVRLQAMRDCLHRISRGDDPPVYDPHITLGHYACRCEMASVYERIARVDEPVPSRLRFDQALFCTYATRTINGPLQVHERVSLVGGADRLLADV